MFHRTTTNVKDACGIMYGKMEKSLKLLRRIYFVEIIVLLIVGGAIGVFMSLYAAPNKSFVYQGRITGADFLPLDDATYFMRIKLFDAATSGNCLWSTGTDRTGANCTAENSAANIPVVLTRSLFSIPIGDTAYHANMPNIASLDFKTTTYFMDVSFATTSGGPYELFTTRTKLGSAASAVAVLDALQANTFNQVPGSYTQINDVDGITTSDLTITVDATAAYPSAGTILIDTEVMTYTGTTATIFTGVTRGALGTTAATHADNATIKTYLFSGAAGNTTLINDGANITAAATTITVDSTAGYPTSGAIRIDNEIITYTGLTATTFTGATRGARGTTAATHTDNAIVKLDIFPTFTITSDGSAFVNSNSTSINPQIGFQVSGTTNYTLGIDRLTDSAANKFKISTNNIAATGTGTLSSTGTAVTGTGTAFTTQISVGSAITANGQTRTVEAISSDTSLTTDTPFSPVITSGTSFTFIKNLLALDSRSAFTSAGQYSAFTFYGLNNTLPSLSSSNYTTLTVTPPTTTLSGSTPVTLLMDSIFFDRPTIASIAAGITDAATFTVAGPPILTVGAMTNAYALKINSASVNGGAAPTNAYGLAVAAPTGATNNYAAIFTGGNVGVGATAPITQLHVAGNVPSAALTSITTGIGEGTSSLYIQGRYAYLTNNLASTATNRFQVIDISNLGVSALSTSDIIGSIATISASPHSVFVRGRYAYVISNTIPGILEIIDISNPKTPTSVGSVATGNAAFKVFVQGRYAYVINFTSSTLQIFDVSNPAAPSLVGQVSTATSPRDIYVQGRYAYVTTALPSLQIFDVSNPASLTLAAGTISSTGTTVDGTGTTFSTQLAVGNAISASGQTRTITAITDADSLTTDTAFSPAIIAGASFSFATGSVSTSGTPARSVSVQGRYAYITSGPTDSANTLQIFDISNPASPNATGLGSATLDNDCRGISVQGRYAYITCRGSRTFRIFDISNPASTPTSILNLTSSIVSDSPYPPFIHGRFALVPLLPSEGGSGGIQVFDIGGAYIQQLETGGLEMANGSVRSNFTINNNLDVRGSVNIGLGGLYSAGPLSINGLEGNTGTTSALDVRNSSGNSVLFARNDGRIGLGTAVPSYSLSFSGTASRTIAVENAAAAAAGSNLLLHAGSSGAGTNLTGGNLILQSGNSTGTGISKVRVSAPQASASGTTVNTPAGMFEFVNGHIASLAENTTTALPRVNNGSTCTNGVLGTAATLNGAHTNTVTTITVNSTADYPATGTLIISNEIMTYTGITATTFTGVTRGTNSTIAATQSDGASVRLYPANTDVSGKVLFTGASSACTLEFAKSYTNAPSCIASFEDLDGSGAVTIRTTAIGTTSATFGLNGTTSSNDRLSYFCIGLGSQ